MELGTVIAIALVLLPLWFFYRRAQKRKAEKKAHAAQAAQALQFEAAQELEAKLEAQCLAQQSFACGLIMNAIEFRGESPPSALIAALDADAKSQRINAYHFAKDLEPYDWYWPAYETLAAENGLKSLVAIDAEASEQPAETLLELLSKDQLRELSESLGISYLKSETMHVLAKRIGQSEAFIANRATYEMQWARGKKVKLRREIAAELERFMHKTANDIWQRYRLRSPNIGRNTTLTTLDWLGSQTLAQPAHCKAFEGQRLTVDEALAKFPQLPCGLGCGCTIRIR
jgi:hypothetical protein